MTKYSAGAIKHGFWFAEFGVFINELNQGKSMNDIRELAENENIFLASSKSRSLEIFRTVKRRVSLLDDELVEMTKSLDSSNKKLINLIAILKLEKLFFEFMVEVIKSKFRSGELEVHPKDFRIFFNSKKSQSEQIAGWTDITIKRLSGTYHQFLVECGILDSSTNKIIMPLIDPRLQSYLKNNQRAILEIFTGGYI